MDQTILNWLLGGFSGLIGFLLHSVWRAVLDLQTADKQLADKVASIEVLVAGRYMLKSEFTESMSSIKNDLNTNMVQVFTKLNRIEDKLDGKADK